MRRCTLIATLALLPAHALASPWDFDVTDSLGRVEVAGDFNADGRLDRAASYPTFEDRGMVGVFMPEVGDSHTMHMPTGSTYQALEAYFDAAHVRRVEIDTFDIDSTITDEPFVRLGAGLAAGDFDNDGYDDLAVGIAKARVDGVFGAGAVAIISGRDLTNDTGSALIIDDANALIGGTAEAGDHFGEVLTAGDVNCDGIDDLIIGVPAEDYGRIEDTGRVHVLYGQTSATGISFASASSFDQETTGLTDTVEEGDHFGASLAVGQFSDELSTLGACQSLAIGVPGEDIAWYGVDMVDAGAVHVLYSAAPDPDTQEVGAGGEDFLTQASRSMESVPEHGDEFGASVGRVAGAIYDDLWIGVPGEWHSDCPTGALHTVPVGWGGKLDVSSSAFACNQVRPDILEAETDRWVEKEDGFGRWYQYIPDGIDLTNAEILFVIHGTNKIWIDGDDYNLESLSLTPGFANAAKYAKFEGWVPAAELKDLVLVVPEFEDWNFGNAADGEAGGYRGLMGRDIRADDWVLSIADRYAEAGLGDDTVYMVGQSAGAQFANRFLSMNPDRLDGVAIQAPQWYAMPGDPTWGDTDLLAWPSGYGDRTTTGVDGWHIADFEVDSTFVDAHIGSVDWELVIGELDTTRRQGALDYRDAINDEFGVLKPICVVEDKSHGGEGLHKHSLVKLFEDLPVLDAATFGGLSCMLTP